MFALDLIEKCFPSNPTPPTIKRRVVLAFLKVVKSTKLMLSAPQLQGPNFYIHVHFHLVDKQLIGISFPR
jgi:hypothetical protein